MSSSQPGGSGSAVGRCHDVYGDGYTKRRSVGVKSVARVARRLQIAPVDENDTGRSAGRRRTYLPGRVVHVEVAPLRVLHALPLALAATH